MKRPSDRKSVYLRVRITKGERAELNKQRTAGESLSDVARRILFRARPSGGHAGAGATEPGT